MAERNNKLDRFRKEIDLLYLFYAGAAKGKRQMMMNLHILNVRNNPTYIFIECAFELNSICNKRSILAWSSNLLYNSMISNNFLEHNDTHSYTTRLVIYYEVKTTILLRRFFLSAFSQQIRK